MNIDQTVFRDALTDILHQLYDQEKEHIEQAAEIVTECIEKKGVVHVFGSGHSVGFGIDLIGRAGSLVPIHIMQMSDFITKGIVTMEDYSNKDNIFERRAGVAKDFMKLYDIQKDDCFIIISNSGINGIVIDLAQLAKERGHRVIIITSMKHTLNEESRHPSGKKLYEYGDLVIDNCGPIGDALLETGGRERVCSVSSICGNCIAQAMAASVCERLAARNHTLPVLRDISCQENKAFNEKLIAYYQNRI